MDTLPTIIDHLLEDPEEWYRANGTDIPDSIPEWTAEQE